MRRATPPFRADHVGSLLRPERLLRAREEFAAGQLPAQDLHLRYIKQINDALAAKPDGMAVTTHMCRGKRRIDEASQYVPLDQLCLSPQCGFSSTVEGNALTYDEEVAKLRLIVDVARGVWGD